VPNTWPGWSGPFTVDEPLRAACPIVEAPTNAVGESSPAVVPRSAVDALGSMNRV